MFHHIGPYLVFRDESVAVSVQIPELLIVERHPFAFADSAVMIGIHVLEHHIDHLFHAGILIGRPSSPGRGGLLCLRKKATSIDHDDDTKHDENRFPSIHLTFPSSRRQNGAHEAPTFAITVQNQKHCRQKIGPSPHESAPLPERPATPKIIEPAAIPFARDKGSRRPRPNPFPQEFFSRKGPIAFRAAIRVP
jgi:hypothetical protein